MNFLRSRLGKAAMAAVVLLALFLIRPGADRLRNRIAGSISLALERPVDISSVSLRLLPQPGFDLQGFVVHEDPAFGAEPTLRADEVTANLRLSSLLRGRLEITRLVLNEPSLNLVQNSAGHWNIENFLDRANRTPIAPTGKSKSEPRPGFPYIEADQGRINFKVGQEKKPYALTEADFSIWQDSDNAWGMRLKAQPMRTDFALSDTGTLRVNGAWQRAASLHDTPVRFDLQWERAQLGQVTKLLYGSDLGWRGTVLLSASATGTPADLAITTSDSVEDFRRYDLADGDALRLAAQCSAHYRSLDRSLPSLSCQAPVDGGFLRLDGSIGGASSSRSYDLALLAQNVPMQALVALARHAKKDIPEDLTAVGKLDGSFQFQRTNRGPQSVMAWTGTGETRGFAVGAPSAKIELALDRIPFAVSSGGSAASLSRLGPGIAAIARIPHAEIGPVNLALGRPAPAVVRAWLSRSDYALQIAGDAQIRKLLQLARVIGLPTLQPAADGNAKVDLQIAGAWSAFAASRAVGSAQLQSVRAEVRGLNEPLEIASASLTLSPDQVDVKNLTASVAGSIWHGSLEFPRPCTAAACPLRFDLQADSIATDDLNEALSLHARNAPWYRFLSAPEARISYLPTLRGSGRISANRVTIRKFVATKVSADVDVENGVVELSDLRADVLGGKHVGAWKADFTGKTPVYTGSGSWQRIALAQLAQSMQDDWITGTGSATYEASASGLTAADLSATAKATLQVEVFAGTLPHIALASGAPLHMRYFSGRLTLSDRHIEIQDGKLDSPEGVYQVSGTASLARALDLNLVRPGAPGFSVVGPLTGPRVAEVTAPQTRAALKP